MEYRLVLSDIWKKPEFLRTLHNSEALSRQLETLPPQYQSISLSTGRVSCAQALETLRPILNTLAEEPPEGWLAFTHQTAVTLSFPHQKSCLDDVQRDAALCFLQSLQAIFDMERQFLSPEPLMDFALCTEAELELCNTAEEYQQFLRYWRQNYIYELLRLCQETTSFRTLEHIAGVHHVAMTVGRAFKAGGGLIDLALMSAAAAGHDLGKFGCRPGEQVPYLHYFYTDQWFSHRGLSAIGHIAANHSVWDLELENLSAESLILVYADFRVKQERGPHGQEITRLYSLKDAFDVILRKLDNVDEDKIRRYQYVYAKLQDFENYLTTFGVDITLENPFLTPCPLQDAALMSSSQVVQALCHKAVDHNIRLMHRLSHQHLFAGILESARTQKDPSRIRVYISIFEEYFTYWNPEQKEQTLDFLYELLLVPDGDVRRQAAHLMGRILAGFLSGYKKELPADAVSDHREDRPFELWKEYLARLIHPDCRLTPRQISTIRYRAKSVTDALLQNCSDADIPHFMEPLLHHYREPQSTDPAAAFVLLDTVQNIPTDCLTTEDLQNLTNFAVWWLLNGDATQKAAALRLFRHLDDVLPFNHCVRPVMAQAVAQVDCPGNIPLLFLKTQLSRRLGVDEGDPHALLEQESSVSSVLLDNLKTATPWILKAAGVEYLLESIHQNGAANLLHIATHFSNLIKVSEHVVVRRMAGTALLTIAPQLTPERRNELAVELSKALETGQTEITQYIPFYLGQFALWLSPRELDEVLSHMHSLLSSPNAGVGAAALSTVGSMLEHYDKYLHRSGESAEALENRRRQMAGLILKGLSSFHKSIKLEALRILGEVLFTSKHLSDKDKISLFALMAKKLLFLIGEQSEDEQIFFYTAAALSHIYRFIIHNRIEGISLQFPSHKKVAFFPGTFDPFSLSHKGIVQTIRNLGFEVYLAVDEFSWSKKTQPSLMRRQIINMSVADEFDVYLFPHDIPVNLAIPEDLNRLRSVFQDRALYLVVGSDVVVNASSYRASPAPGSVHFLNHIIFRRSSDREGREIHADLSVILGDVVQLQLPTHLEDISSSRIRENIDLGRDVSSLIDPTAQDFICRNSLYLREPQYKRLIQVSALDFVFIEHPSDSLRAELAAAFPEAQTPDSLDSLFLLRDTSAQGQILAYLTMRIVNSNGLFQALRDEQLAHFVRTRTAGRILLLTGLYAPELPEENTDTRQLLLTEVFSHSIAQDCNYAVWWSAHHTPELLELLARQGFLPAGTETYQPLLLVDMRSPVVLMQNIPTTLKEPFSSDPQVLSTVHQAHCRFQEAVCGMYPGVLVLSLNAEVTYHRLVRKITALNGVPLEPTVPRKLGPKMCVPFGKFLRGSAIPNTVTKTIHTDKVFASDLRSFSIAAFPGYAPLESQIRTIHSFRRPVILVDDLLHSGNRLKVLEPLCRQEGIQIDRILVGILSGQGKDLMDAHGQTVDSVYFFPNLRAWFVESTMYPFIGGDAIAGAKSAVYGLIPAVNLILPYAFPRFYKKCGRESVFQFSQVCLQNSRDILLALENAYRTRYTKNLTLSRLNEAVILPLAPDKGRALRYDPSLTASACLDNDLNLLLRMRDLLV